MLNSRSNGSIALSLGHIVRRIRWLADNVDVIQHESLAGDLAEFFKFRAGDYRIIYQVEKTAQVVLIHAIGHRREIHRDN